MRVARILVVGSFLLTLLAAPLAAEAQPTGRVFQDGQGPRPHDPALGARAGG